MGLLADCKKYFGTDDLYEVLQTSRTASQPELKKAYKQMSLLVHPDRVDPPHLKEATRKFQLLSKIHLILSDSDRKAIYDETGSVDEEHVEQERNWFEYWRVLFPKITTEQLDNFMKEYVGSEEERENLKSCYLKCGGDMNKMCHHIMTYNYLEEDRYRSILLDLIEKKEIPDFPAFTKESAAKRRNRRKKYEKEAKEAETLSKELNLNPGPEALVTALAKRSHDRKSDFDDMILHLEQKYGKKPRSKKGK